MFNIGQRTAVRGAFKLAGYEGRLMTLRADSPDERIFVLGSSDMAALRDVRVLEQVLQQVLGCKVAVAEEHSGFGPPVPFE